ncbi:hypothetical protein SAMN05421636_10464 [Pricia antarctica]|uniref:Uncharacterized protein n=1 Tax=Pricia antarctica TaxID=641691 RepID=A0A1G7B9D0_9FLAO|nr:hypothetical protein SAMN05421636_10464 [Pricia antarctica]
MVGFCAQSGWASVRLENAVRFSAISDLKALFEIITSLLRK